MKVILAINAGSSSVKISVYSVYNRHSSPSETANAQVSGLTALPSKLTYTRSGEAVHGGKEVDATTQDDAFSLLIETLIGDEELRCISSSDDVDGICHLVVHGGDYEEAQVITEDTYHHIEALNGLAPLHNGTALGIIDLCFKQLPAAINIAYFDSQFHISIPDHISTYPIDPATARKNSLRKYGFHGISYAFITRSVARFFNRPQGGFSIIALHLGSGASACAIKAGKSWDTSMGLTPLSGLPGATRSGDVDPR
jgi:acetate kinase